MINNFLLRWLFLIPFVLFNISIVPAQMTETEIGIEEHLGEYMPLDVEIRSEHDSLVTLGNEITKPTVLNFVYFRCPGICTPLMNGLADVVKRSDMELGKDYQIITISFDPTENPEMALRKKKNYMKMAGGQDALNGWKFYTADSAAIAKLTQAAGFKYRRSGNEYLHTATLIMLGTDGKISRYLNGVTFLPFEFKLGILEASQGKTGATINRVLQYCFSYDPAGQKYVLNITRVMGVLLSVLALFLILYLSLKPVIQRRRNK
jgi:protein SCO1